MLLLSESKEWCDTGTQKRVVRVNRKNAIMIDFDSFKQLNSSERIKGDRQRNDGVLEERVVELR